MAERQNRPSSVDSAQNLLAELKSRAEEAHKNNDNFMMSIYTELLKVTSPIVTKALARYHRDERARINDMARDLRAKAAVEREKAREQKANQSPRNREG